MRGSVKFSRHLIFIFLIYYQPILYSNIKKINLVHDFFFFLFFFSWFLYFKNFYKEFSSLFWIIPYLKEYFYISLTCLIPYNCLQNMSAEVLCWNFSVCYLFLNGVSSIRFGYVLRNSVWERRDGGLQNYTVSNFTSLYFL